MPQLAHLVAVAEEGSFTRAADRLHVVQSAVSAGVRKLEKELDASLFDRSTHSVKLTDAGRVLPPEARATLAAAQAAKDAVDEVRGGLRGTIVLGTMQAQGMRAIDLAFVGLPGDPPPGIEIIPITSESIMLAGPAEHPLAKRRSVGLATLTEEPLVDLPTGWGTRIAVDRSFTAAGVTRTITYEVNDTATMVALIRNKLAVGTLPASFVDTADKLALIPIRDHLPQFQTAIATPANRRLSASTRALLETIGHIGADASGGEQRVNRAGA